MARTKKYREEYTEHLLRHPDDHVSYTEFRYRMRKWGSKLAIRMGKIEGSIPERIEQRKEKLTTRRLHKVEENDRKETTECEKLGCIYGIVLFALGVVAGVILF